jgi:antitoxin YefM
MESPDPLPLPADPALASIAAGYDAAGACAHQRLRSRAATTPRAPVRRNERQGHANFCVGLQHAIVTRIMVMFETLPLANVKSKFSEMVDRVEHTHDRIIVTRNGRPAAVLISPEELESLEDTLELLSDPEAMRQLDESRQAYAAGDFVTGEELRSRYLTK